MGGSKMIVYHGATQKVEHPVCTFGRPNLDFGQGFYVTDIKEQAEEWAHRQADARKEAPVLNVYEFDRENAIQESHYLLFSAYDKAWLHFIVDSRNGLKPWEGYDIIEGGIANDRVIDTVNLYSLGLMNEDTALSRLSEHQPNNQICVLSQMVIEKYLVFQEVKSL
ncbi:MAG: DUF3990 domain-containing protein [Bacteroidales bacterium]|nr:DUF3990 domain-containing protein [Bacteroidales bacterium]